MFVCLILLLTDNAAYIKNIKILTVQFLSSNDDGGFWV